MSNVTTFFKEGHTHSCLPGLCTAKTFDFCRDSVATNFHAHRGAPSATVLPPTSRTSGSPKCKVRWRQLLPTKTTVTEKRKDHRLVYIQGGCWGWWWVPKHLSALPVVTSTRSATATTESTNCLETLQQRSCEHLSSGRSSGVPPVSTAEMDITSECERRPVDS